MVEGSASNFMAEKNSGEKIIASILLSGGIGIFPTDTLYGVVGSALNKKTVERIYKLRRRDLKKPMIILISSKNDLKKFGIKITSQQEKILRKIWPGKISVIFDCPLKKFLPPQPKNLTKNILSTNKQISLDYAGSTNDYFRCGGEYLHRGTFSLALRLPKDENLIKILKKTGPLVAPSANIAGKEPAKTFAEAKKYFGEKVDFYVDKGKLKSTHSTLIKLNKEGKIEILRQGAIKLRSGLPQVK